MDKPKVGKLYFFVRAQGGSFEYTVFTRHADDSAGFTADGFSASMEAVSMPGAAH